MCRMSPGTRHKILCTKERCRHASTPSALPKHCMFSDAVVRMPEESLLVALKGSRQSDFTLTKTLPSLAIKQIILYSGSVADSAGVSLRKKAPFDPKDLQE